MDAKICTKCGASKSSDKFDKCNRAKSNHRSECKECRNEYRISHRDQTNTYARLRYKNNQSILNAQHQQYKREHPEWCREYHRRYREQNPTRFIAARFSNRKSYSKKIGRTFNISIEYLLDMYNELSGKCAITGLNMLHKMKSLYSISIDRTNSSKGYTKGNIQLVCKAINLMKGAFTNDDLIKFLDTIKIPPTQPHKIKRWLLYRLYQSCKRSGKTVSISIPDLSGLWNKQTGKCALTDIPMICERNHLNTVSLDRIDSAGGYVKNNVQLVCKGVNQMKSNHPNCEALQWIERCKHHDRVWKDLGNN